MYLIHFCCFDFLIPTDEYSEYPLVMGTWRLLVTLKKIHLIRAMRGRNKWNGQKHR